VQRSRPALRLERNPLVIVLAQTRISPILRLSELVPQVQEALRPLGFPRFTEIQQPTLSGIVGGGPPTISLTSKYSFVDRDASSAVVLSSEFVAFEVTQYSSFETFADRWGEVIQVVGDVIRPDLVERIGLRYVDLIQPRSGERIEDWLKAGLQGLDLDLSEVQSRFELAAKTKAGDFVFRATRPRTGIIPLDLQPFELEVRPSEQPVDGGYVVLDFDHFSTTTRDYARTELVEAFWQLHDFVDLAFRASVTDAALEAWGAHK
jgi:uncharacterized protein (TIGR04255 family)